MDRPFTSSSSIRVLILLAAAIIVTSAVSLGIGRFDISPLRVGEILASAALGQGDAGAIERHVVLTVRLPRVLMALMAGAGLALCGAALQGVFRNPLVGPHIIGVSSGAAFGGTLAILIGSSRGLLLVLAFAFGMLALLAVYLLNALSGRRNLLVLVLAGVIVGGFFGALVSLVQYLADA